MNAKISVFVICVEGIIYLLQHNLHDYTLQFCPYQNTTLYIFKFVQGVWSFFKYIRGVSRTSQTSKMELSAKIVNGWKPSSFAKSSILDALSSGYTSGFRTVYYFCQKLYLRWLGELWIYHCMYIVKKWINEISKVRYEKLKRKTINMFCLILWIAVRKIS